MTRVQKLIHEHNVRKGAENRATGEHFERKILNHEKKNSIFAMRSSGSYGPVDVMSQKKNGEVWYISSKRNGYFHPTELLSLRRIKEAIEKVNPHVRFKLAYYINERRWKYENLK